MDPKKASAEWFRDTVFRDEAIRPQPKPNSRTQRVPSAILAARAIAKGGFHAWQSREDVFLKQAKLLENYMDDYDFDCSGLMVYYPTYQSLTDWQLRAYFSWRTRLRRGEAVSAPLTFLYLYLYEIINQIGVADPMDGYQKLLFFRDAYVQSDKTLLSNMQRWQEDYVVYYDLDPALLSGAERVKRGSSIAVLERIQDQEDSAAAAALVELSPWLQRSGFYARNKADMDRVMIRVLRRIDAHCAKLKNTMADRYLGERGWSDGTPFANAVFCDPLKRKNYTYALSEQWTCICKNGIWSMRGRAATPKTRKKLDNLLKTIDASLRAALDYGHPLRVREEAKWISRLIEEEVNALMAEKQAAEQKKVSIDFGQLSRIRRDAAVTQEKLTVDEDMDPAEAPPAEAPPAEPAPKAGADIPLDPAELRLLQCLLCGGDTGWVAAEGHLLSVLADGINEKLYDTFADNVLDDGPQVAEDYIDDLKEMICP